MVNGSLANLIRGINELMVKFDLRVSANAFATGETSVLLEHVRNYNRYGLFFKFFYKIFSHREHREHRDLINPFCAGLPEAAMRDNRVTQERSDGVI